MKKNRLAGILVLALAAASCGGTGSAPAPGDSTATTLASQSGSGGTNSPADGGTVGGASDEVTPEAPGALEPNTIRIGSQVWKRTLPMTSGQCLVVKADGTLLDWGTVWGTVDDDDDTHFNATYGQDGTFSAQVTDNFDQFWGAGVQFQADEPDLVIELDFDNLTLSGNGTFHSLNTGENARGSFLFTCLPEDQ